MKFLRVFLPLVFLVAVLLQGSCAYYQRYQLPKNRFQKINEEGLSFYLLDAAHPMTRAWYVSDCKIEKETLTGYMSKLAEIEASEVFKINSRLDAKWSKEEVLLFAKPQYALSLPDTGIVTVRHDQLEKIEVYEMNHGKTFGAPLLGTVGFFLILYTLSEGW